MGGLNPSFPSVEVGQPTPADGEFEITRAGVYAAAVVKHPRIPGSWMAMVKSKDWRESGMKRFKTRNGAVRYVSRMLER